MAIFGKFERNKEADGALYARAEEILKNSYCPCLCWNHPYPGNQALIQKGALPVDKTWDGSIPEPKAEQKEESFQQISLFEGM